MSTSIKLKKSSISGRVPSTSDLDYGELAINYADGILYFKNSGNTVQSINASPTGIDSAATINLIDSAYVQARQSSTGGTDPIFKTISVSGESDIVADVVADTLTLAAGSGMTITTDASTDTITFASTGGNNFGTIAVSGDSSIDADTGGDTVTFEGGTGVEISTNVAQKKVTISATPSTVYDFGSFSAPVQFTLDMGAI